MLYPILAGITSFVVSFAFLPFIIAFTKKKSWSPIPVSAGSTKK